MNAQRIVLAGVLALAFLPVGAAQGDACTVLIEGQDVADGGVVQAPDDGDLDYRITSTQPIVGWSIDVRYAGFTIPVLDETFPPDGLLERAGNASIASITRYGTGHYDVTGQARLQDGSACDVAFVLAVEGSPFRSLLGLVAVGLVGAGAAGLIAMLVRIALDANDVRATLRDFVAASRRTQDEAKDVLRPTGAVGPKAPGRRL